MVVETTLLKLFYFSQTPVNCRIQLAIFPTRQWRQREVFQKGGNSRGEVSLGILGRWSSFLRIRTQMSPDRI